MASPAIQKEFDLVVFGATGFTGQFVVEEVARVAKEQGGNLKWAVAGRSSEKLKRTLQKTSTIVGDNLDQILTIIADVKDVDSLLQMCKRTKVVINCVGPYRFCVEPVVAACIAGKAHHVEISGEPQYLESVPRKYHEKACEAGVYIISARGWNSIPTDMRVTLLKKKSDGGELDSVERFADTTKIGAGDEQAADDWVPPKEQEEFEKIPLLAALLTYLSCGILGFFWCVRVFLRKVMIEKATAVEKNREGYVGLYQSRESRFTRSVYRRICDCWNHPICSVPGAIIEIKDRVSTDYNCHFKITGATRRVLNMGSYNYLGFAESHGICAEEVEGCIKEYGAGICSTRHELGTLEIHRQLERLVANFLGVEDSVIIGMGFATNSTNIPTLTGKGCLILSDELNHASLILGCRLSGAISRTFKHNNMVDLEKKLRDAIVYGQPRTHRPWKNVLIIVEGVYSMEGSIVKLHDIIRLKKKYKAYVYLDEAHSIGSMGRSGRGVIDYYGCEPKDIDLLMGTFTKSFGAAGGYIAGSKEMIDHLRMNSHSFCYGASMPAPIAQQIITSMQIIMGEKGSGEGQIRIKRLARNSRYFRQKLRQMGFIVYGNDDSPVVPMLVFLPFKMVAFVRGLMKEGVATAGVCYPITKLIEARVRFCMSASHTKEMLDKALHIINELGDYLGMKYSSRERCKDVIIY